MISMQSVVEFFGNLFNRFFPIEWRNVGKRRREESDCIDCDAEDPPVKKLRMNPNLHPQGSNSRYFANPFYSRHKNKEPCPQISEVIDVPDDDVEIPTISLLGESTCLSNKENKLVKVNASSPLKSKGHHHTSRYSAPFHCRSPNKTKFKHVTERRRVSDDVEYVGTYSKDPTSTEDVLSANSKKNETSRRIAMSHKSLINSRTQHIMNLSMKSPHSLNSYIIYDFHSRKKYGELLGKVLKSPELFSCSPSSKSLPTHSKIIDLTIDEPVEARQKCSVMSDGSGRIRRKSPNDVVDLTTPTNATGEVINLDPDVDNTAMPSVPISRRIVSPVNTLSTRLKHMPCTRNNFLPSLAAEIEKFKREFMEDRNQISKELAAMSPLRKPFEKALEERLQRHLKITSFDLSEDEEEKEAVKPQLTDDMISEVMNAWDSKKPKSQVLVNNFNYQIKRSDLQTLSGLNWLNDEVINFYMELVTARGKEKDFPSVHTFSTFFYPKLEKDGYSSLRRWTRKVDIFSYDMIVVPIHLRVHWCLAIINFKKKTITYFDSMGQANNTCVNSLKRYLDEEHKDKKKEPYDTSDWNLICTTDTVPQQMNSCDCGVFACTFAEYTTREAKYNFTQEDMPYFRRKMTYEILKSKLQSWN